MSIRMTVAAALLAAALILFAAWSLAGGVGASEFQDRYIIAGQTYGKVSASMYDRIYHATKRRDVSSARTMVDAAHDWCVNQDGGSFRYPSSDTPFKCVV